MNTQNPNFTEPEIVTTNDLKHRSYVTFYFNNERVREYHGKSISQEIDPNRSKTIVEKQLLLKKLQFELHKALDAGDYPKPRTENIQVHKSNVQVSNTTIKLLFNAIRAKLRYSYSRTYKRDLKSVYREFKAFITDEEAMSPIASISLYRIESFLNQYGSSGTYYMNKRRNLAVLFSAASRQINQPIKIVKETPKKKIKAKLHEKYSKEQLKPILDFLKDNHKNLHLCCLLTYATWLRPHEEIRLLTVGDFKADLNEIHLSGDENKGGKIRVVHVPDYVKKELLPTLTELGRNCNIFTKQPSPFNYSYFNTQWSRAYPKMLSRKLVYENQTIYSFRHTAVISLYKRTKDVYLLQKLLGHSSITVTLKYLRTLGELGKDDLVEFAPELD